MCDSGKGVHCAHHSEIMSPQFFIFSIYSLIVLPIFYVLEIGFKAWGVKAKDGQLYKLAGGRAGQEKKYSAE